MKTEIIEYKKLKFQTNAMLDYLELLIDEENFYDESSYIESISIMLEFALYRKPKFLIINKLTSHFKLSKELFGFTMKTIYSPLKAAGVTKVIMLVDNQAYEGIYKNIEKIEPFMIAFKSIEEIENWITKKIQTLPNTR